MRLPQILALGLLPLLAACSSSGPRGVREELRLIDRSDPDDLKITGMYSNLELNEEGGDLLGMELYLVYGGGDDYFALVQCAEGSPERPVLAPVKVEGSAISFTLAGSICGTTFTGVVSKDGLRGRFAGQEEGWLPRRRGYWE